MEIDWKEEYLHASQSRDFWKAKYENMRIDFETADDQRMALEEELDAVKTDLAHEVWVFTEKIEAIRGQRQYLAGEITKLLKQLEQV